MGLERKIIAFVLFAILTSCKSYFFNKGLEKMGAFNSSIKLTELGKNSKKIVFIPMKHFATESFYDDTKVKIDSLKKLGYYFFYEGLNVSVDDKLTLRKFRKLSGLPITKPGSGYMYLIDSLCNFKIKRKLIDQPQYAQLGIDSFCSKRVDLELKDIITGYESRYSEIILEECDFKTSVYKKSPCKYKEIDQSILDYLILNSRNEMLIKEVLNGNNDRIAIIYGEEHFIEIKKVLLEHGFKLAVNNDIVSY